MATTSESVVLVTGAAGFIGQAVLQALSSRPLPQRVVGIDRVARPAGSAACDEWRVMDVGDAGAVRSAVSTERPAIVYHVAGLARGSDWGTLYGANVRTTITLLEAIRDLSIPCVTVVPGSAAEYGPVPADRLPVVEEEPLRPLSPYGVSKAWQTLAGLSFVAQGLDVRVARPFNIIGPRLPESFAFGTFGRQLIEIAHGRRAPSLTTGYLGSRRDFIDLRDAAAALVAVAERGSAGEIYNVCSGAGVSMHECLEMLIAVSGLEVTVNSASTNDPLAILDSVGSNAKISRELGWRPQFSLDETIRDFWSVLQD